MSAEHLKSILNYANIQRSITTHIPLQQMTAVSPKMS